MKEEVCVMQKAAIRILLEAGEPDALKDACPVREGGAGKGLRGTSLVSYFTSGSQGHPGYVIDECSSS